MAKILNVFRKRHKKKEEEAMTLFSRITQGIFFYTNK